VSVGQFASCAARCASDSFFSSSGVSFGGSTEIDRTRNLVERFFNKIKQCRRVATPYDKLAANYLAFVKLASIRIWLRANESAP
jgi:transposase